MTGSLEVAIAVPVATRRLTEAELYQVCDIAEGKKLDPGPISPEVQQMAERFLLEDRLQESLRRNKAPFEDDGGIGWL